MQTQPVTTVSQLLMIDQQQLMMHFEDADHGGGGGGKEEAVVKTTRTPVSRRSLRKILSRLHVDTCGRPNTRPIKFLLQDETRPFLLLRFPINAFGMCLGERSQAMLWKTLQSEP